MDADRFRTTHWSLILDAAGSDRPAARLALHELCAAYRRPLLVFLEREGYAEAEDLTQQFFETHVVTGRVLRDVRPENGRFRSWLRTCLKNMVKNERQRAQREKRGGALRHLPLELDDEREPALLDEPLADRYYDRSWAVTLVTRAYARLEAGYRARGDQALFENLSAFLPSATPAPSYAEVASRLGQNEPAVRKAVSRLRESLRAALRAEVEATLGPGEDPEEELRYLLTLLCEAA
jgi:RNA polymerase sigma-70 factor (ECF subfamily)